MPDDGSEFRVDVRTKNMVGSCMYVCMYIYFLASFNGLSLPPVWIVVLLEYARGTFLLEHSLETSCPFLPSILFLELL
jgi:hypothetical protein